LIDHAPESGQLRDVRSPRASQRCGASGKAVDLGQNGIGVDRRVDNAIESQFGASIVETVVLRRKHLSNNRGWS